MTPGTRGFSEQTSRDNVLKFPIEIPGKENTKGVVKSNKIREEPLINVNKRRGE